MAEFTRPINLPNFGKWLLHTIIGYIIAVIVATFITVLFLFSFVMLTENASNSSTFENLIQTFLVGIWITTLTAWPGYLVTLAFSSWKNIQAVLFFAICGVCTAILATWILELPSSFFNISKTLRHLGKFWFVLPGGFVGGLTYAYWRRWFYCRA